MNQTVLFLSGVILAALFGSAGIVGLSISRRARVEKEFRRTAWLMVLLLILAGLGLGMFITYAFAFADVLRISIG